MIIFSNGVVKDILNVTASEPMVSGRLQEFGGWRELKINSGLMNKTMTLTMNINYYSYLL